MATTSLRPVAVLDACVLVPPGLRDVLLSCADSGAFRPVWQSELEAELLRNGAKLLVKKGASPGDAAASLGRVIFEMNGAFPDARLDGRRWRRHVAAMTNDPKDRHVLATAVGAGATHVVTSNMRDFKVASRPAGVSFLRPDAFLLELLTRDEPAVLKGLRDMCARNKRPPKSLTDLADRLIGGDYARRFGAALKDLA